MLAMMPRAETGYAQLIGAVAGDIADIMVISGGSAEKGERAAKSTLTYQQQALERAQEQHQALSAQYAAFAADAQSTPSGGANTESSDTPGWLLPALGLGAVLLVVARRRAR